ncbi:MAG: diguanylate cyclase [Lachnospiraceae bacterium]|nr:diguanylate cyclase [Lachnospiraceae bacterium]
MTDLELKKRLHEIDMDIPDMDIPLAIIKHEDGFFSYVKYTNSYLEELNSIGYTTSDEAVAFFNNKEIGAYDSFMGSVLTSLRTNDSQTKDFVAKDCYCSIKILCKYLDDDHKIIICRAWLINLSKYDQENYEKENALRSLYSLYEHINFIDLNKNKYEKIYINKNNHVIQTKGNNFTEYSLKYADEFIHPDEKDKYIDYYKLENINDRFEKSPKTFDMTYFRTLDINGEYVWKSYVLIHAPAYGDNCYYECVRGVDLNTEHILVKENYIDLFNNLPVAYSIFSVTKDNSGKLDIICIYSSKKMAELMEIPTEEMIGRDLATTIEKRDFWEDIFSRAAFNGENISEIQYIASSQKWIRITMSQAAQRGRCAVVLEDITQSHILNINLGRERTTDDLIIKCTKLLHGGPSFEDAMNDVLSTIGSTLNAKRIYILEIDDDGCYTETFEWVSDPNNSVKHLVQKRPASHMIDWDIAYPGATSIIIDEIESIRLLHPEAYDNLYDLGVKRMIEIPIIDNGTKIGCFGAVDYEDIDAVDVRQFLETLSYFISAEVIRKRLLNNLEKLSVYDTLCNVKNRNAMELKIKKLKNSNDTVGVFYADANGLKKLNDLEGHDAGDSLLKNISEIMSHHFIRDNIYRAGGDEFLVIHSDITKEEFNERCQKIKDEFDSEKDMSIATGWYWSDNSSDITYIMNRADKFMYEDKAAFYMTHDRRKHH